MFVRLYDHKTKMIMMMNHHVKFQKTTRTKHADSLAATQTHSICVVFKVENFLFYRFLSGFFMILIIINDSGYNLNITNFPILVSNIKCIIRFL